MKPVKNNEERLATQTAYMLFLCLIHHILLSYLQKLAETLTCKENRVKSIQRKSEEENEGPLNNTIDYEKNNSDADLERYYSPIKPRK